jgi:flagellar biosynthesis repressor protein FlbT
MNITLRAGERIYINGAVLRVDRKATIELLNDVTFLLEAHVMQANDATTPLRQIYFVVQLMVMDPVAAAATTEVARGLIEKASQAFESREIRLGLQIVWESIGRIRYFEAMKMLRSLYGFEEREMFPKGRNSAPRAA